MRSTPVYEVHAIKYAHLPRKAWEVQIQPDPHDADFPMDYFVWVAIPLDEAGNRAIGGKPIVIDTGFNATVGKKRGREVKRNPADLLADFTTDGNGGAHYVVATGPTLGVTPPDTVAGTIARAAGGASASPARTCT